MTPQAERAGVRMQARRAKTAVHGQAWFTTAGPPGHGKLMPSPDRIQYCTTRLDSRDFTVKDRLSQVVSRALLSICDRP